MGGILQCQKRFLAGVAPSGASGQRVYPSAPPAIFILLHFCG